MPVRAEEIARPFKSLTDASREYHERMADWLTTVRLGGTDSKDRAHENLSRAFDAFAAAALRYAESRGFRRPAWRKDGDR